MLFPLHFRPKESYKESPRSFGSGRPKGRLHAGCDLYAPAGTPVLAVDDGTVLIVREFYENTWQITVDHGEYWVRYGEVSPKIPKGIKPGAVVSKGQIIAHVGFLARLNKSMLHFEMFTGKKPGELSNKTKPYNRRADLIDPTSYLDEALVRKGVFDAGFDPSRISAIA